jgi:hypothetical protein
VACVEPRRSLSVMDKYSIGNTDRFLLEKIKEIFGKS